ncbi:MAG: YdeI/OmpD-associated family protein [Cellulophaga sp.]
MKEIKHLYFKNDTEWRKWLHENHANYKGIYLIFYKVDHEKESMRWEEAVQVAICYGWIDSTVKSLGDGKRQQYFSPRNPKSVWSKLNKNYIVNLTAKGLMQPSGLEKIKIAKENGSWVILDDVENGIIPQNLQDAFSKNPKAYSNYKGFSKSYQKGYLYWLKQAKREETKQKRIQKIIQFCNDNIKSRENW